MKYVAIPKDTESKLIRIDNRLASARGDFDACALDILFYILADYKKGENTYRIKVKRIEDFTGRSWNYQQFVEATEKMGSRMYEYEDDDRYIQFWMFQKVEYLKGKGTIEVELSNAMIPLLENLKDNWTGVQVFSVLKCDSKYAKRLYLLASRWRSTGIVNGHEGLLTISDLKEMLGLKDPKGKQPEKYKNFADFKKNVLDVAQRQINANTDIVITYKLEKLGRNYEWINIYINGKAIAELKQYSLFDIDKETEFQAIHKQMTTYGISDAMAVEMAKAGPATWEAVRKKGVLKTNQGKIKDFPAFAVSEYQKKGLVRVSVKNEKK